MSRKAVYLIMAIVGSIVPYLFFGRFFAAEGLDLVAFVSSLFVNGPAGGFTSDLLLTSFVFWLWSFHDARRFEIANWWIIPVVNLLIGLSAALPFYMYLRFDKAELAPTLTS